MLRYLVPALCLGTALAAQTELSPPTGIEAVPGAGDQCFGFCCVIEGRLICNPEVPSQPASPLGPVIMHNGQQLNLEDIRQQLEMQVQE
ncbi:hypothetical protein [Gymnodinialimonas sp.]